MDAGRDPRALEYGFAIAALCALAAGALARAPSPHAPHHTWLGWLRPLSWLTAFPGTLAAACAVRPEHWNQLHYGTLGVPLLWFTSGLYAVRAAAVSAEPSVRVHSTRSALTPATPPLATRDLRKQLFALLCAAGALAIAWLAPTLGGMAALERDFGDSAGSGGVLTAVVAGALAVAVLGVYMAEGLRDHGPAAPTSRRVRALRAIAFSLLALLGLGTYLVIGS